jgi:iron complex outermembrane receptor protein
LALGALALPAVAAADDAEETIIIVDHAPGEAARDRDRALGDAPFVTVLHPDDHPAIASVADAVATAVGAHTRSLGGLGAYASVTVRGAAPGHTAILIDGIPLARIAEVTTDLGRFAAGAFGEVDLYRGAVPIELGGAGVGGALNLITRLGPGEHGERITASLGAGSFGARHVRLHYGDAHGGVRSSTTIGYQGATGDYRYFDDNSTPLNPADDMYRVRHNNGFDALDGATRWSTDDRKVAGGVRVAYKRHGLPGSTANPALGASLATTDVIGDGAFDASVGELSARQLAYVLVERQHLGDPLGELGLGATVRDSFTLAGGASSTWKLALGPHRAQLGGELRGERFRDRDATGDGTAVVGNRLAAAITAAADVVIDPAQGRLVVTPAFRLDLVRSAPTPATAGPTAFAPVSPRREVVPSPRLTARFAATRDVAIKGSAGWYARLPTLVEVFGNRGYLLGSPDLRPERGPSGDLGAVWAPAGGLGAVDRILVEADLFAHRAHDTIAFVPSGGFVTRAINIGDTQAYGAELVASARYARMLSVTASYTRLVTEQLDGDPSVNGKPVPREPGHALDARAELAHRVLGHGAAVWLETTWQAMSYLDPVGLGRVPARTLVSAGARVEIAAGVAVSVSGANLTDIRITHLPLDPPPSPTLTESPTALSDVAGFPLPGRSLYLPRLRLDLLAHEVCMTKTLLPIVSTLILAVCACTDDSKRIPRLGDAIVVAGDFQMAGVLSALDIKTQTVSQNVGPPMAVGIDPMIRHIGTELFIVNRAAGNNVTVLDDTTLAFKEQLGTGANSNPQDVALVGGKLYVPTLGTSGVTVLTRGSTTTAQIDLSADDPDGKPDCNSSYLVDTKLYVACGLLDDDFKATGPGKVYVIDTASDTVLTEQTLTLTTRNPISQFERVPSGAPHAGELLLPTAEFDDRFAVVGGCVERVVPGGSPEAPGCMVTNRDLGGYSGRLSFQLIDGLSLLWAAVSVDFTHSTLRVLDMPSDSLWPWVVNPESQVISDVVACPTGEIIAFDRTTNANGLRVYLGTEEQTTQALPIGIGSFPQHGLLCY